MLLAGFIAGILVTGAQMLRVTPLIFQAETYELGGVAVPHLRSFRISHQHNLNGDALDKHLQIKDSMIFKIQPQLTKSKAGLLRWYGANLLHFGLQYYHSHCFQFDAGFCLSAAGKPVNYVSGLLWGAAGFASFLAHLL
ncbi:MAG: hypothetical protein CM1200mP28_18360 [Deltaproteobacteria bacterium]|nr:MAG: hypothetical protein CM1200mP28_18360 [Deltaproteobacteria bacterium]